ncbi:MAG: lipopolysaccharide biosynthesis protein [Myxococcales bacterium]|nr:lipopolysaccharide biosynthesis protein [Myxococcales bacterium]
MSQSFASQVARSLLYSGLGNALSRVIFLVGLTWTLKLVTPADFGLASVSLALIGVLTGVADLGLSRALVQAKDPSRGQIDSLMWLGTAVATATFLVLCLGAPLIADFYGQPELTPILRVHSAVLMASGIELVPRAQLTRELSFGRLVLIDNLSLTLSAALMVYFAQRGLGPWAIVAADVANRGGRALLCQLLRPHLPRLSGLGGVGELVNFGAYTTGSRLLYNLYVNADYLIVGKVFGPEVMGIYAAAYRIVFDPLRAVTGAINQVVFPALARLREELPRLRRYYFTMARTSLLLVGTLLLTVAVFVDWGLRLGGYEQWLPAVPFVHAFAIIGVVRCVSPLVPQLLNANGQARDNFFYSTATAAVMPLLFLVGSQFGIEGVVGAWIVGYPFLASLLFFFGARALQLSWYRIVAGSYAGMWLLLPATVVALGLRALAGAEPSVGMSLLAVVVTLLTSLSTVFFAEREAVQLLLKRRATT